MIRGIHYILIFGVCALFLLFAYGRIGQLAIDKAVLIISIIVIVTFLARGVETELKYMSPKFVSDPIFSTANWQDIRTLGNYAIVRLGSFDALGLHYKGGDEGTAIISKGGLNKCGESVIGAVKLTELEDETELPPEIYRYKEQLQLTKPLYLGVVPYGTLASPTEAKIEAELKEKNAMINMMSMMLKGKMDKVEEFVEASSRITERKRGIRAFLKDMFKEEEKE